MSLATGLTLWEVILPGLLIALIATAVLPWLRRDHAIARPIVALCCIAVTWRYLYWRVSQTLPPLELSADFAVGVVFLVVEFLCVAGTTISLIVLARTRSRSKDADQNSEWLERLPQKPLVDVLICTYNEDGRSSSAPSSARRRWTIDNFRLWILDDGRRPWLQELCERLQCGYLTRADNAHAKAGNINSALSHLAALAEPPDFISHPRCRLRAQPHFLRRALACCERERRHRADAAALLQSRTRSRSNLSVAHVWPDEQRYFFDVVMASKDAWGAAFCCGTSSRHPLRSLIRVSAAFRPTP